MIRSKYIAVCAFWLACWAGTALMPATAFAQDQAVIDKLVQMNKKALDDYDTLDFDSAKKRLLDALMTGKKAGLDNHPVLARTYIHLGAVYLIGFKDRQKALQSFGRALDIDPNIQLSKGIDTPEVTAAFQEAQRGHGGGGGGGESAAPKPKRRGPIMESDSGGSAPPPPRRPPPPPPEDDEGKEPDLPVHVAALDCPTPDEAIIDRALLLRCAVAPNLPVASVVLLYRAPGKDGYTEEVMTKSPKGWLQATIPKKAVTGKSIQFYFEGRNAAGKAVVANGGADSPNIVLLVEESARGEASAAPSGVDEEENPLADEEGPYRPRLHLGHRDTDREGLDTRYGKRKWWIGIGLGTGYGYAKGNGFEAVNKSPETSCSTPNCVPFHSLQGEFVPGLAWAGLGHLAPEVGYAFNPDIALSLEGRIQYIGQSGQFANYGAKAAISVLAKLLFYTKQNQLRFFGSLLAGGGEGFRFVVYPASGQAPVNGYDFSSFKDTVLGGPFVAGAGGGVYYELAKSVSAVGEIHALAGLPTFSVVVDFNAALQFNIY
jgi:hypothetical protein